MNFQSIFEKINPHTIEAYQEQLARKSRSPATLRRRASSIRQLCKWATQEGYLQKDPQVPRRNWGRSIKITFSLILLILGVILIFLLSTAKPPSFPTQVVTQTIASYSPWIVSFRGRLLSPGGELILDEAKVIFRVYSQEKNGDSLWQSKTWELAPNEQGEFQAPIGDTTRGDYELPSQLFFQNERLWLEAVVNSQPLSPRTPLSTASHVSDALGLGGSVLTNQGNLILAANSPKIQSTQGTFAIEGQAVTINTPAGSDGNITLAPDGSGVLNLILSSPIGNLINATDANLGSSGSKESNNLYYGKVANNNTNYNLLKLESGSTPTPKFTVDASGNVSAAGNVGIGTASPRQKLTVDGTIGILESGTSPTYHTIIQAGDQSADITYTLPASVTTAPSVLRNNGSGALSWGGISSGLIEGSSLDFSEFKDNMTLDGTTTVAFGSRDYIFNLTGTGDFRIQDNGADFFFASDAGNIGIGTTNPGSKLQVAGNITPATTTTYDLGSSALRWQKLWAKDADFSDAVNIGGSLTVQGTTLATTGNIETTGNLTVDGNSILGNSTSDWATISGTLAVNLRDNTADTLDIQQGTDNYININTTDSSETLTLGNSSTNPTINFATGTSNFNVNSGQLMVDGNGNITLDPSGAGDVYFHGTIYNFSDTGDWTIGGRITFENNAYLQNETDGILYFNEPTLQLAASTSLDIDSPLLDISSQATNFDLKNSTLNALSFETSLLSLDTQNSRVGIGTTSPLATLDVQGTASVSGNLTLAGGARTIAATTMNTLQIGDGSTGLVKIGTGTSNTTATGNNDLYVSGDFEVDGNVLLGESTANTLTISSYVTSDLIPNPGSQYNLGSNTRRWFNIWGDTITGSNLAGTVITGTTSSSDWLINSTNSTGDSQDSTLTFERGTPAVNTEIRWDSTNKYLSTNAPGFVISPDSNISFSGKAALIVNQIQSQDIFIASASGVPKFVISNAGNVGIGTTSPTQLLAVGSTSQFNVSSTGAVVAVGVNSGSGPLQGTGGLTVTGTGNINATGISATNIGNSTGALTLASGGTSAWTNTSGNLTIQTATSGNILLQSIGNVGIGGTAPSTAPYLFVGSTGNVGIGNTNPGSTLIISNNAFTVTSAGVVTGGTYNKVTITAPATGSTLTIADGKTLTANNSLTLAGTDTTTITFQGTDTYVGRTTTDTLTNKTLSSSTNVLGGVTMTLGSDATGDIYYRNSSGVLTRLAIGTANQVLHGGTTPSYSAIVAGDVTADSLDFSEFKDAMALDALTKVNLNNFDFGFYGTGNVGVGTTSPVNALTVSGNMDITGNLGIGNTGPTYKLDVAGGANLSSGNAYFIAGTSVLNATTLGSGVVTSSLTTVGALNSGSITSGFGSIDTGADNIVTTGTMGSVGATSFTGNDLTLDNQFTSSYANTAALNLTGNASGITFGGTGVNQIITGGTNNLALMPGGNVGIGTTGPNNKLEVLSTTTPQLRIAYDTSTYFTTAVAGTTGAVTFDTNGTTPSFTFSDAVTANTFSSSGVTITGGTINGTTIGASTPSTGAFTTLTSSGNTTLGTGASGAHTYSTGAGSTTTLGNSTGALTLASGGTSAWTNTSGNLTISTGTLALTSAGALNLSAGSASTWTLPAVTNALNIDSNTLTIDALNDRVGIGTTSPSSLLDVNGTAWLRGVAAGTGGLFVTSGNVGVGTTAPAGPLHVVGNCVTGDTLLKRRRRKKGKNGQWLEEWEDVRIDQIQEGDEILTLDEETGEFVVQKVRRLLNMGKKGIYKLTTQSGKTIRTTAEHPYLTLTDSQQAFAFIDEAGVGKAPDQPVFGVAALYARDSLELNRKIHDIFTGAVSAYNTNESRFEFKFNAVTKDNLPFFKAIIKTLAKDDSWSFAAVLTKKNKTWNYWNSYLKILPKLIAKAPFAKLTVVADYLAKPKTIRRDLEKIASLDKVGNLLQLESQGSLLLQVADILLGALHFEERQKELGLTSGKEAKIKLAKLVKALLAKKITAIECLHAVKDNLSQTIPAVKRQKWLKVKDLSVGAFIATVDGWEKIAKIEKLPTEPVWDIEVENTHNFVANGIVAHNTYIMSGNVGIGTTSPGDKLDVAGNILLSGGAQGSAKVAPVFSGGPTDAGLAFYTMWATSQERMRITNQGNVGIGTTNPSTALEVNGTVTATDFACTDCLGQGNIGASAIGQGELKSTLAAEVSVAADCTGTNSTANNLDLGGGTYGFYPNTKRANCGGGGTSVIDTASIEVNGSRSTYRANIYLKARVVSTGTGNTTSYAQQQYVQASPPYFIEGYKMNWFVYYLWDKNTGFKRAAYSAEDPPYENANGQNFYSYPHPFEDYYSRPVPTGMEIAIIDSADVYQWIAEAKSKGLSLLEYLNDWMEVDPTDITPPISPETGQPIKLPAPLVWRKLRPAANPIIREPAKPYNAENYSNGDLAELFPMGSGILMGPGDVVDIHPKSETDLNSVLSKSKQAYSPRMAGIISTSPSIIANNKYEPDTPTIPLALSGKVPVNVSLINGPIKPGDSITSSEIPGLGMKATKAGPTVAKVVTGFDGNGASYFAHKDSEGWQVNQATCQEQETCYPVGQVIGLVNNSWYDPDVYLTDIGDLKIASYSVNGLTSYELKDKDNNLVARVSAFAEAAIANLTAGQVKTELISPLAQNLTIDLSNTATASGFGKLIIKGKGGEEIVSIDATGNATFSGEVQSSKFKVQSGEISGDATISGTLYAKRIESEEISALKGSFGELLARVDLLLAGNKDNNTESNSNQNQENVEEHQTVPINDVHDLTFLTNSTLNSQNNNEIANPDTTMRNDSLSSPEIREGTTADANDTWATSSEASDNTLNWGSDSEILTDSQSSTESAELSNNLLAEIEKQEITNVNQDLKITSDVKILGKASLADTTVAGSLNVGGGLVLAENSINSLTGPLYLNSLGLGGIDILAGKVTIDTQGNVNFEGNVTIKGTLAVNEIVPLSTSEVSVDFTSEVNKSGFGKLLVKGNTEITGDLVASGSGTFQKIIIANANASTSEESPSTSLGTSKPTSEVSIEVSTNATAGEATLPAGAIELTIKSPFVTEKTLIYITPTSPTQNKVIYVSAKKAGEWFKVAIDNPVDSEIKFNWWIIN